MPEKRTIERAKEDAREGKSTSTQAGEFVREEMHHIREGKHGARSTKQAIAIGLSKARRAGVPLRAPRPGTTSEETRAKAERDTERARKGRSSAPRSAKRSRAVSNALKREGEEAATPRALSRQATSAARKRSAADRSRAARKAAATKGAEVRSAAARKAARTRKRNKSQG
jgi:uncharacterized protein DUF6496